MKLNYILILFILSFLSYSSQSHFIPQHRRILHQPLYASSSAPPPPPPPPGPDHPFFHELPGQDQGQPQLPQSPPTTSTEVATPVPSRASSPVKKLAIAIASTVLTLAMLSALVFYFCKHRASHTDDSQKLVAANSRGFNEESRMPPSTFLYIGTVEPSSTSIATEACGTAGSPYRKLNSGKRYDRYRPSPDLQPLPPLPKPPPPNINTPPPMSSSDDESPDFYTPQGSSISNESPRSRQNQLNNIQGRPDHRGTGPFSKRASPKSRLAASKSVIIPSIKQPLPPSPPQPPAASLLGPLQPSKTLSYSPKRANFPAPPPLPDMARLRSKRNDDRQPPKLPVPAPPPPPPPAPHSSIPTKLEDVHTHPLKQVIRPQSNSAVGKSNSGSEKTSSSSGETNKGAGSSEKINHGDDKEGSKPRLRPLHWDKVRNTSDRATVWDQLKSSSFQLNEDAMESLFGCNSVTKEATRKSAQPTAEQQVRILDPKKSQNIAILLRALNVTKEEVSETLLDGNPEGLGPELLETLVKMAPTKEEEIKLRDYNGESLRLGSAERFLKAILDIPFAFKRVEAMLYRANFDTEVAYLRKSFQTLEQASEELKNSRLLLKLLEAVLRTGNRMNDGTNRGDARAFKLETLLKLVDVKGTDGKTTLLHFVVQEIIRSEGVKSDPGSESQPDKLNFSFKEEEFKKQGLQIVAGLSKELGNVKRAAGMDSDVLSSYVSKLEMGLEKVKSVMQHSKQSMQGKFFDSMKEFLSEATVEITRIKAEERKTLLLVREVTEYFHGDAAKEEAHPFRIFMIVRDFLSILDNVCKDVGRMHDRATMGTGRSFRMPAAPSLPVLDRYNVQRNGNPNDDGIKYQHKDT